MTETAPIRQREGSALDRYCLCESYARATERAALAGARWLGRADQEGAERDSAEAMRSALSPETRLTCAVPSPRTSVGSPRPSGAASTT